jgi:two-component system OmpR family response regulator
MRILVIEDDAETRDYIQANLTQLGHAVEGACDGGAGLAAAAERPFDVIVVDRMLPGVDGLEVVRELRARDGRQPLMMLTALGLVTDRIDGLQGGADDYLVKPFSMPELAARIEALARRVSAFEPTLLSIADLRLDRLARVAKRGDVEIDLQAREFQLLEVLMLESPRVVTRTMLLQRVWQFNFDPGTNLVESHISRLRSKIDRGGDRAVIHTVRGAGYAAFAR